MAPTHYVIIVAKNIQQSTCCVNALCMRNCNSGPFGMSNCDSEPPGYAQPQLSIFGIVQWDAGARIHNCESGRFDGF